MVPKALTDISNINEYNLDQLQKKIEEIVCGMYGLKTFDNVNTTFIKTYQMKEKTGTFILKNRIDGAIFPLCELELYQCI